MKFNALLESVVSPVDKILQMYRIKNNSWQRYSGQQGAVSLTAEMSEISHSGPVTDPWNRPLDMHKMTPEKSPEGEIMFWHGQTTVTGVPIPLVIYND